MRDKDVRSELIALRTQAANMVQRIDTLLGRSEDRSTYSIIEVVSQHPFGLTMTELNAKCRSFREMTPTEKKNLIHELRMKEKIVVRTKKTTISARKPTTLIFPAEDPADEARNDDY